MNPIDNTVSSHEMSYRDENGELYTQKFVYSFGYLNSISGNDDKYVFSWSNKNLISIKYGNSVPRIEYSDVEYKTKFDFINWLLGDEDYTFTKKFLNNIRKNILEYYE